MKDLEYYSIQKLPDSLHYWQEIKKRSEMFSHRLKVIAPNYAKRIEDCCSQIKFYKCRNGYLRFQEAWFCRVRGCPMCEWRRSCQITRITCSSSKRILQQLPSYKPMLIYLPFPECDYTQIKQSLQALKAGWTRLCKLKLWKVKASVSFTNLDFCDNQQLVISMHCLAFVNSSFYAGTNYISRKLLTQKWNESLRLENQRPVTYQIIDSSYPLSQIGKIAQCLGRIDLHNCPDDWLKAVMEQIHKSRLFSTSKNLSDCLKANTKQRHYYPSELKNLKQMTGKIYHYVPNPEESEHENNFLDAEGLIFLTSSIWKEHEYQITDYAGGGLININPVYVDGHKVF